MATAAMFLEHEVGRWAVEVEIDSLYKNEISSGTKQQIL